MTLPNDLDVRPGQKGKPIVFLLHGTSGSAIHMTDPEQTPFDHDYAAAFPPDRDVGWRAYPGVGVWSFQLDPPKPVTSWRDFFADHGFGTVTYSQVDPNGLLAAPAAELAEVVTSVMDGDSSAPFVLLGHSRGGLLIRKFLKDNAGKLTSRIRTVITLHSPHQGDRLASIATTLNGAIDDLKSVVGSGGQQVIDDALGWLTDIVGTPAFSEFSVGSPFLTDLANGETALPNVQYYTFGGTSVLFSRIVAWVYTLGSAIPQWHWPPFDHVITMVEVPGVSPIVNSVPDISDEVTPGKGDILVADAEATLPFAVHRTNSLSHAEALWDRALQLQVLALLESEGGIWS
jgi:hypothetical protein